MESNEAPLFVVRPDDAERAYAWPCIVNVPMADGTKEPRKFVAKFKLLSDEDEKYLRDPFRAAAADRDRSKAAIQLADGLITQDKYQETLNSIDLKAVFDPNLALLNMALQGFVELKNVNGEAVPDTDAIALIRKLSYTWFGLARGYWEMRDGRLEKN